MRRPPITIDKHLAEVIGLRDVLEGEINLPEVVDKSSSNVVSIRQYQFRKYEGDF